MERRRTVYQSHVLAARYRYQPPREPSRATPRQNRADDVVEHEGGFCRRTHVTSDSFSTPASRRRAFIPTSRATPPFASLDRHPARVGIGRRDVTLGWESALRRGVSTETVAASRGITSLLASRTRDGRREDDGGFRRSVEERGRRARNKRSPAGLPPTVPREITRRTPP